MGSGIRFLAQGQTAKYSVFDLCWLGMAGWERLQPARKQDLSRAERRRVSIPIGPTVLALGRQWFALFGNFCIRTSAPQILVLFGLEEVCDAKTRLGWWQRSVPFHCDSSPARCDVGELRLEGGLLA